MSTTEGTASLSLRWFSRGASKPRAVPAAGEQHSVNEELLVLGHSPANAGWAPPRRDLQRAGHKVMKAISHPQNRQFIKSMTLAVASSASSARARSLESSSIFPSLRHMCSQTDRLMAE